MTVGKRRRGREMALQMLYQRELGGCTLDEIFASYSLEDFESEVDLGHSAGSSAERRQIETAFLYAQRLVAEIARRAAEIDSQICRHAANWRVERMPVIDRNILRIAICEVLDRDVPWPAIVDEAVELAKRFGSKESGRFVNGILDAVIRAEDATLHAESLAET